MNTSRVLASDKARELIHTLQQQYGELIFHQSGGCCDGSQPMCFEKGDFRIGGSDVCLGNIEHCGFWMSKDQFEYWQHTQLIIDVVSGRGSSFSLEIPLGVRFITRSRIFTEEETNNLEPLSYAED
jgi:uncharacterized protein